MKSFSERLINAVTNKNSILVAGIDPNYEQIPDSFKSDSAIKSIKNFYLAALPVLKEQIAIIKPNIAFFEALGIPGLELFQEICVQAKKLGLIIIADVKRGEIGSTAKAYSQAFLAGDFVDVDAITVNPFLGTDTLEPFLSDCKKYNKGIFILAKTSNPGSGFIQSLKNGQNKDASTCIAEWIQTQAEDANILCSIGAVVGCTYPEHAKELRKIMPSAVFLVPGYGAQGGSAKDALAAYHKTASCIVNSSRALFTGYSPQLSQSEVLKELETRLIKSNQELNLAAGAR